MFSIPIVSNKTFLGKLLNLSEAKLNHLYFIVKIDHHCCKSRSRLRELNIRENNTITVLQKNPLFRCKVDNSVFGLCSSLAESIKIEKISPCSSTE